MGTAAKSDFPLKIPNLQAPGAFALAIKEGLAVFPIRKGKKFPPEIKFVEGEVPGSCDPAQLAAWAKQFPGCNWGVRTGHVVGQSRILLVLDQDDGSEFALPGFLPHTRQVRTPNGTHFYMWLGPNDYFKNATGVPIKGFDIRAEHGYVVCPGSVVDGKRYKLTLTNKITPIGECPEWLTEILDGGKKSEKILPPGIRAVPAPVRHKPVAKSAPQQDVIVPPPPEKVVMDTTTEEGQRNTTLTRVAGTMRRTGMDQEAITAALLIHNRINCVPPLDDREVMDIARSVSRYEPQPEGKDFHLTDMGNASRLVYQRGKNLHYSYSLKKWFVFDGRRWAEDVPEAIEQHAKGTVLSMYKEAADEEDPDRRKALGKWAAKCESGPHLERLVRNARSEEGIPISADQLDSDGWAMNILSGTVNLRTGELRPHRREDLNTKIAPVEWVPTATCPKFDEFLDLIMDGRPQLVEFLWQSFGWSLTGDVSDELFFIFHGQGMNGKSQLIKLLHMLMGDYAVKTGFDTFLQKNRSSIRNDIQRLRGARFVSAMESEEGDKLAMALVKEIVGGDLVVARMLYKEFAEWQPQFKLFFGLNHLPTIRGQEFATWRRVRLVPFDVRIEDRVTVIGNFAEKVLRPELPGILQKMVRACLKLQENGMRIPIPEEVAAATEEYKSEQDILGDFILEQCVEKSGLKVAASELYTAYKSWADRNGHTQPLSQRSFGLRLRGRGLMKKKNMYCIEWAGIGLLDKKRLF